MTEPISGFLEFRNGPHVLVRGGYGTKQKPDEYLWGCYCSIDGDRATVMGFTTTALVPGVITEFRRLLHEAGLRLSYDRLFGDTPYRIVEIMGFNNGELRMTAVKKTKRVPLKTIFKPDGTVDKAKAFTGMAHTMEQEGAGYYTVSNGKTSETVDSKNPAVMHHSITWDSTENDPSVPGAPSPI